MLMPCIVLKLCFGQKKDGRTDGLTDGRTNESITKIFVILDGVLVVDKVRMVAVHYLNIEF